MVEDGVVFADEDVSENPERSVGSRDIDAHETRDANRHSFVGDLK